MLRLGLVGSSALVLTGLILAFATGRYAGHAVPLGALLSDSALADRVIAIGLVILALTPVLRVVALIVIWAVERDRRFVVLGLIVAAILAASLVSGWRASPPPPPTGGPHVARPPA
ncbi:MAG: DUF1634 domain-containing protein [Kofleriaceae bacterium]